jgi:uncharacterized membrane protein YfcA
MAGALAGSTLSRAVPAGALLVGFAALMLATAVTMLRGRAAPDAKNARVSAVKCVVIGGAIGVVAGLVGAGGGFLIVPALALVCGLSMPEAIGTSLLVIVMQSLAGVAGHVGHVAIDARLASGITAAAVIGSVVGARMARRMSPDALRTGFAWLVLVMALLVLGKTLIV